MQLQIPAIIRIKSKLYMSLRYKKAVKSASKFTKYMNACKIPIALLYC